MNIEQLTALVEEFKQLPINKRETTLFDIGSRGHFENPMTEVLSFFCDPTEVHGMNDLVVSSIVSLIRQNTIYKNIQNAQAHHKPQREVTTKNNKRIDLLLSSDEWVIAIESKVYHQQINPFEEYETYVNDLISSNKIPNREHDLTDETEKQAVFVILSPDGKVDGGNLHSHWCGISFQQLVNEIKNRLQQHFFEAPFNKWSLVLKDFLLHLGNLVNDSQQNNIQEEFALTRLNEITQVWDLLKNTLLSIQKKSLIALEQRKLTGLFIIKKSTWFGLPTTILYTKDETIEVALFADGTSSKLITENDRLNAGKYIFIQIQIKSDNAELELGSINECFANKSYDQWYSGGTHYFRWPVSNLSVDGLTKELVETYVALNELHPSTDKEVIS
jgi:hypothetical protein